MIFPLIVNQQSPTVTFCESALFTFFCLLHAISNQDWGNFVPQGNVIKWNFTNNWQQHKKYETESALFSFFCLLQSPIKSGGNFVEQGNVIQWNFTNSWQQHKKHILKLKWRCTLHFFFCNIQSPIKSSWGTSFHREMSSNEIVQYVDSRSTQNYNRIDRKISQKLVPFILLFLQVF